MAEPLTNPEHAQTIALQALAFVLSSPKQLEHFLSETGFSPQVIRANAQAPELLEAVLNVLVNDEALLLSFAANSAIAPQDVVKAHAHFANAGGRGRVGT